MLCTAGCPTHRLNTCRIVINNQNERCIHIPARRTRTAADHHYGPSRVVRLAAAAIVALSRSHQPVRVAGFRVRLQANYPRSVAHCPAADDYGNFTVVFSRMAGLSTDGTPPFLFCMVGNIAWAATSQFAGQHGQDVRVELGAAREGVLSPSSSPYRWSSRTL